MMQLASFVAGRWQVGSGRPAVLVNPATETLLAQTNTDGIDFAEVIEYARQATALRSMSFQQRAELLRDVSKLLHVKREEFLDLAQQNGGNTRGDAKFDVDGAIGTLAAYAGFGEALAKRCGERRFLTDGDMLQLTRSPRFVGQHVWIPRQGIAVHVNAFNFPAWGTFEKIAVAWLAGINVITKPATATAALTYIMVKALVESGRVPEGALQLVCGSTGDLLGRLGPQDHLAFTGSNTTGAALRGTEGYASRAVRVNVEADSLNAAVIGPDVEPGSELWNTLLRDVATDMTQKTGQKCTVICRVIVPEARLDDLQDALVDALSGVVPGDPTSDGVTLGPVSTAAQLRDVLAGIRRSRRRRRWCAAAPTASTGATLPRGRATTSRPPCSARRRPRARGTTSRCSAPASR